jgi:DNA topoisomerase-1
VTDCPICSRESASGTDFCRYHEEALIRLRAAFTEWERAMGIEWDEYLSLIAHTEGLGSWVGEIVAYLTSRDAASVPS